MVVYSIKWLFTVNNHLMEFIIRVVYFFDFEGSKSLAASSADFRNSGGVQHISCSSTILLSLVLEK